MAVAPLLRRPRRCLLPEHQMIGLIVAGDRSSVDVPLCGPCTQLEGRGTGLMSQLCRDVIGILLGFVLCHHAYAFPPEQLVDDARVVVLAS